MEYKELTEKINKNIAELVTYLKVHEAYLQAFANAGLITNKESTEDHKNFIDGVVKIIQDHTQKQ